MKTKIYFIRHGKVNNEKQIIYGRLPGFRLSMDGEQQIQQDAQYLKRKGVEKIFSSPLLRSRQSARIIANQIDLDKIYYVKKLNEIKNFTEGKSLSYAKKINFDYYFSVDKSITDETMEDIAKRMLEFVYQISKKYKTVVAITHGDPIMILNATINKQPMVLSSIRTNKKMAYISYGEIFLVTLNRNNKHLKIKSVFKPS